MSELKQISIFDRLRDEIVPLLEQRRKQGIVTYGHELTTWTDLKLALLDLQEELLDAFAYAREAELEMNETLMTLEKLAIEVKLNPHSSEEGHLAALRAREILKHFTGLREEN